MYISKLFKNLYFVDQSYDIFKTIFIALFIIILFLNMKIFILNLYIHALFLSLSRRNIRDMLI